MKFQRVDVEENFDLARQHNIRSVPVMVIGDQRVEGYGWPNWAQQVEEAIQKIKVS